MDAPTQPRAAPIRGETRVLLRNVPWDIYERLVGADIGARLTYLAGMLEIMSPSGPHEVAKKMIGRLLEAYAEERRIELNGFGSTTFRRRAKKLGLEADECYVLSRINTLNPARPDLAIEVVYTRWEIDKLKVYRGLAVPEVWVWRKGRLEVHELAARGYERRERSVLLPDLDLALLTSFVTRTDQVQAILDFRHALGA